MVIDHVVPKDKGGKDSVLNYALTTRLLNNHKATALDEEKVKSILYIIETVYAPRVLKQLRGKEWKGEQSGKGERTSIYIPDDVFLSIQDAAKKDGRSVSNYLVQLHKAAIRKDMGFIDESGSISEKAYASIETGDKPVRPDKFESHIPKFDLKDIKKKAKKVVEEIPSMQSDSDFFNPQPKKNK